jgi:hypothetical protein
MRPPAVPLITHDPYFSVRSMADELTAQPTKHWTGANQPLLGLARIDGTVYRFMGTSPGFVEPPLEAMTPVAFQLTPTRTIYGFEAGGVRLDLTFLTPALPHDLEVLARPLTYVNWDARASDGQPHEVSVHLDANAGLVRNRATEQRAMWSRHSFGDLSVVRLGSIEQNVLTRSGDDLRIDWGYLYLAAPGSNVATIGTVQEARPQYVRTLDLPATRDLDPPVFPVNRLTPVIGVAIDLGRVGRETVSRYAMVAYDDEFSVECFYRKLRPYWRRDNRTGAQDLLTMAARDFASLKERRLAFDEELTQDLVAAGGSK